MKAASEFPKPMLILLVGAGRTGKDTIGDYLKTRHGFSKAAFAKPLYEALGVLYGVSPVEWLADKDAIIPRLGRSPRELLQHLGDHARRECGPDILIRRLVERTVARGEWKQANLVITDGRMDYEVEWARPQGASIWWLRRDNAPPVRPHQTESIGALHVKQYREGDFVLYNHGADALIGQVEDVLSTILHRARGPAA